MLGFKLFYTGWFQKTHLVNKTLSSIVLSYSLKLFHWHSYFLFGGNEFAHLFAIIS